MEAVPYSMAHTRALQSFTIHACYGNPGLLELTVPLLPVVRQDLLWWLDRSNLEKWKPSVIQHWTFVTTGHYCILDEVKRKAYKLKKKPVPFHVTAYSTKSVGASWAYKNQASAEQLCYAATWPSVHSFSKHYRVDFLSSTEAIFGDHSWLLGDQVDLLPFLLLPLAGGEEYTEEEMETLPPDLQYLPEDKQRESDPDIRKMLIESVQLLCATPGGRRTVKQSGTYLVMRSLHSWEMEPDVKRACEKLIQVLISDEPEPRFENLLEVTVPPELEEQLRRLDEEEERAPE
ncbi:protein HGH1 homolog [Rhinophrynus dorsalis]